MKWPVQKMGRSVATATGLVVGAATGLVVAVLVSNLVFVAGSRITTASANLSVSDDGVSFSRDIPGFEFTNIMPGSQLQPSAGKPLYLRNNGTSRLGLQLKLEPLPITMLGADIDLTKFYIALTPVGSDEVREYSLGALMAGEPSSLNLQLDPGQQAQFKMQVRFDHDALQDTSNQLVLDGLNLIFDGTAENT